jgi:hypothetical protein
VRFETRLADDATSAELRHALSALAAACCVCGEEVHALQDEAISKEYLLARGESPCRVHHPHQRKENANDQER